MGKHSQQRLVRVVVDSNSLNSADLQKFLGGSPLNYAVITDYAWMEAYKANSVVVLRRSLSVLANYPDQALHLWGTKKISGMDFRSADLGSMMVRKSVKKDFTETLRSLGRIPDDFPVPFSHLTPHVAAARDHLERRLLADMAQTQSAFPEMQNFLSPEDVAILRKRKPITVSLADKIFYLASETSAQISSRHPRSPKGPSLNSYPNSFIYRNALGCVLYFIEWVRQGSPRDKAVSKVRNDLVDLNFATFGTYFNGVLTRDKNLQRYHDELRIVLRIVGARMPPEHVFA